MMDDKRPGIIRVGLAPTRLPADVRPRLTRLARRAADVCHKAGAKLLAEVSIGLEVALLDLQTAEERAKAAERRAQDALNKLGEANNRIRELVLYIKQRWLEEQGVVEGSEFSSEFASGQQADSTAVRENPILIERCKKEDI